jgi:2-oxoglutarate dehydrogenase E2 component (dihydrolipoamide succinyltransferase)
MGAYVEIRAPENSEGTRSQVQRWLKSIGDSVAADEPLIEVETDKVTIEIAAPADGVLRQIAKGEQEEIAPGELLGAIETGVETEETPDLAPDAAATNKDEARAAGATPFAQSAETLRRAASPVTEAALTAHAAALTAPRLSPAVRRLLEQHGLKASSVRGTGEGGRVTVDDVLAHISQPRTSSPTPAIESGQQVRRAPHSMIRKRIAERMVESLLHTAPHVTTVFEADLSAVLAHRAAHREDFERRGAPLTLTAYFLAACVDAILEVPEANSRWTADALEIFETIDIGVGTAVEGKGLLVPVVRNVHTLDLFGIAQALGELVARARADKLTSEDMRGGTFTISNHGVSGSLVATPIIINQPQSAILGVGKLEKRAVVVSESGEDRVVVRPRCFVTLTIDHRVMDGHRANRFLEVLVRRLESWS